jgi:tetratricopeptide (TPR) repeat protein
VNDALSDLDRAIELDPRMTRAYYWRSMIWSGKNDLSRAVTDLTEVIELSPRLAVAYANRGLFRLALGKDDEAEKDFSESLRLDPNLKQMLQQRIQSQKEKRARR